MGALPARERKSKPAEPTEHARRDHEHVLVRGRGERLFFTDGGPTVAGTNPAIVAVFARALTTFSQHVQATADGMRGRP